MICLSDNNATEVASLQNHRSFLSLLHLLSPLLNLHRCFIFYDVTRLCSGPFPKETIIIVMEVSQSLDDIVNSLESCATSITNAHKSVSPVETASASSSRTTHSQTQIEKCKSVCEKYLSITLLPDTQTPTGTLTLINANSSSTICWWT